MYPLALKSRAPRLRTVQCASSFPFSMSTFFPRNQLSLTAAIPNNVPDASLTQRLDDAVGPRFVQLALITAGLLWASTKQDLTALLTTLIRENASPLTIATVILHHASTVGVVTTAVQRMDMLSDVVGRFSFALMSGAESWADQNCALDALGSAVGSGAIIPDIITIAILHCAREMGPERVLEYLYQSHTTLDGVRVVGTSSASRICPSCRWTAGVGSAIRSCSECTARWE